MASYSEWQMPDPPSDKLTKLNDDFLIEFQQLEGYTELCKLATNVWRSRNPHSQHQYSEASVMPETKPLSGTRNICIKLKMPDNTIWLARLRNTHVIKSVIQDDIEFAHAQYALFSSEVATMQYVREKTSIPVPEVYDYDATFDNVLGGPYMLMQYIHGRPFPGPFEKRGVIHEREIEHIHEQLVDFMVQMSNLTFPAIGQLRVDGTGQLVPGQIVDRKDRQYGPSTTAHSFYTARATSVLTSAYARGASQHDLTTAQQHLDAAPYAVHSLGSGTDTPAFPLMHTDLHWQNILLDDECNVVGIIDWEGAQTVPPESFKVLPFNVAEKLDIAASVQERLNTARTNEEMAEAHKVLARARDELARRVEVHEGMARDLFQAKGGLRSVTDTAGSSQARIAAILETCNWGDVRGRHAQELVALVERVDRGRIVAQAQAWSGAMAVDARAEADAEAGGAGDEE